MAKALQRTSSALLALLLAVAIGWQGASLAAAGRTFSASTPICKCCDFNPAKCATAACCARPADSRSPLAPAAPRPSSGTERQAVAAAPLTLSTLPRLPIHDLPFAPPPIRIGAVPIFQRYCSFLI